jgi:hypothetical protein
LYLRNAPRTEPIPRKINSRPFIDMKFVLGLNSGIAKKICWHFYSFENSKV